MNFDKIMNVFSPQDPVQKQLSKLGLYSDTLTELALTKALALFAAKNNTAQQQAIIKNLVKNLQNKGSVASKLKTISFLLEISKVTQFDIADIIMSRKMKIFTKISKLKFPETALDKKTVEIYICSQLIAPIYNYLMKLSVNQELYKTCFSKSVPFDDIFRRGSKIRFIWIFKVYNLIHTLIPIVQSLTKLLKTFPNLQFCKQLGAYLFSDLVVMNNFIVIALNQAAHDNYLVMPYFDMLQFYQSMTEQFSTSQKIFALHKQLINYIKVKENTQLVFEQPLALNIDNDIIQAIQVQALRVKLISNSLKNPKKDHTRLETQYHEKSKNRILKSQNYATQFDDEKVEDFSEKYKNLD